MGVWKTENGKSYRGTCSVCSQDFSRRHVRTCILVEGTMGLEDLECAQAIELGENWTVLDLFLNDGRWVDFETFSNYVMDRVEWREQRQRGKR